MNKEKSTTIKETAIKFDVFIRDGGIGSSMFFVLILLVIVNTHSLHYLFGDSILSWIFAVIGSIGFSIATTAVIRKPVSNWMKYSFPIFDTILVFLGLNLLNSDFEVRFIMSILFALFTGVIILSLGTINFQIHEKEQRDSDLNGEIQELLNSNSKLQDEIESLGIESEKEIRRYKNQLANHNKYKEGYINFEVSRIKKKKEKNLTDEEGKFLSQYGGE